MNIYTPFIYISVFGTIVIFAVSSWGSRRGYYQKGNFWFDDIMHFSAGLAAAIFCSAFTSQRLLILLFVFIVGVLWELAEYLRGIYKKDGTGTRDTIEDLVCDVLAPHSGRSCYRILSNK